MLSWSSYSVKNRHNTLLGRLSLSTGRITTLTRRLCRIFPCNSAPHHTRRLPTVNVSGLHTCCIYYSIHMLQSQPPKLLDQVRQTLRFKHYSYRTEQSYLQWIKRFILFHHKRHPRDMGREEVEAFLTHLAVQGHVTASTQNVAFSAVLFLYRDVLQIPLEFGINAMRAKESRYLPTVLTPEETKAVIQSLSGTPRLVIQLLYGSRAVSLKKGKKEGDVVSDSPESLGNGGKAMLSKQVHRHRAENRKVGRGIACT